MTLPQILEQIDSTCARTLVLNTWECSEHLAGSISHPDQLKDGLRWIAATAPGTVVMALQAAQEWDFEHPQEIDSKDWWFRTTFSVDADQIDQPFQLCFDGLATLAEVWLNGKPVLMTDNMFRKYRADVCGLLKTDNELSIIFRSISEELKRKRPRPRWKTNLVNNQQLRWLRTSLQGRIPGWSSAAPPVGPWREVRLESQSLCLERLHLLPILEGTKGTVRVEARLTSQHNLDLAKLRVGNHTSRLDVQPDEGGWKITGELSISNPAQWFPHTHGIPALYDCELFVESQGAIHSFPCSPVGFRQLDTSGLDAFQVRVNGRDVYCRGACWTVSDLVSLNATEESLRRDLTLAKEAGVNMLRVGGTMVYESDLFYQLCDELGILVWQDFMFANMDYPVADSQFRENITAEVTQQLTRLAKHPCIAVYCGNSEIEQQAAMLGMPRDVWRNDWFATALPDLCKRLHPGVAYLPSTPCGGVLPFHTQTGVTHYYGIGAYLRTPAELRRDDIQFTSEALGFSNLPEQSTVDLVLEGRRTVIHDPAWKRRIPRDTGAGWDFEDVRDHYLRELYGVDPVQLRSWDMPRYWQLSQLVPGEMMAKAFSEWRCCHSHNRGGLVWFYKDLWPGAGWGIVDSTGLPKAAYYYLKRIWKNRQLTLTDEGLNGLHLHLTNERDTACDGSLEVALLKEPNVVVAKQEKQVHLDAQSRQMFSADEILGGFYDVNYAYRFGAAHHDIVIATLYDAGRNVISEAFHFLRKQTPVPTGAPQVKCSAVATSEEEYRVLLCADQFLHGVHLTAAGYLPNDNYFHLSPGRTKVVTFRRSGSHAQPFRGELEAVNLVHSLPIPVDPTPPLKGSDVYAH